MAPLDAADWVIGRLIGADASMPPNRLRIRIGAGNRLLGNQLAHRTMGVPFWLGVIERGDANFSSNILDLGCGCGRFASCLQRSDYCGTYTGLDLDAEMIDWCRKHFDERFTFHRLDDRSVVYNPEGTPTPGPWPVEDASQDFVFSISVLTHLLSDDLERVLAETARVLRPGRSMNMSVFCLDLMGDALSGRWTFKHQRGPARIESEDFPEAAVAYDSEYLRQLCARLGFEDIEFDPGPQSMLRATRASGPTTPAQHYVTTLVSTPAAIGRSHAH